MVEVTRDVALAEALRALHVWPQFVADTYADTLTPRQIEGLYAVGKVAHEAADFIEADRKSGRDAAVAEVVAWLRDDADLTEMEAAQIVKNTSGNARQNAADWAELIGRKRGLASAIERQFLRTSDEEGLTR